MSAVDVRAAHLVVHLGRQDIPIRVTTYGPLSAAELVAAAVSAAAADQLAEHGRGPLAQPTKEDRP